MEELKNLFNQYRELIAKTGTITKSIIAGEELVLKSEFQIERASLFDKHQLPAKDGTLEERMAKNDDERKVIKKGLLLLPEHQEKRFSVAIDKLMLDQTALELRLAEREMAFAMATYGTNN